MSKPHRPLSAGRRKAVTKWRPMCFGFWECFVMFVLSKAGCQICNQRYGKTRSFDCWFASSEATCMWELCLFGLATSSWEFVLHHNSSTLTRLLSFLPFPFMIPRCCVKFVQFIPWSYLGNSQRHHNLEVACNSWSLESIQRQGHGPVSQKLVAPKKFRASTWRLDPKRWSNIWWLTMNPLVRRMRRFDWKRWDCYDVNELLSWMSC